MKIRLAVTPGDPDGIGYEVLAKTLKKKGAVPKNVDLTLIGAPGAFKKARIAARPGVEILFAPEDAPVGSLLPGYQAGWSIEAAVELIKHDVVDALVTGPIHKGRLNQGGYRHDGHTGMLSTLTGTRDATMMLANRFLRVSLVTCHVSLQDVPRSVTPERIERAIQHTADYLRRDLRIKAPRIAVLSLNPHAGEGGLFGDEDERIVAPTVLKAGVQLKGLCEINGPFPSDTFFAKNHAAKKRYDAVVCMYHDQALIPVKLLDFPNTVNITLGLPLIRTSVDHGTAFDIAGKGIADPSSLIAALHEAAQMARNRKAARK